MKSKLVPVVLLVAALAGIGASIGWAVSRTSNGPSTYGPGYGMGYSMMGAGGQRAAWYLNGSGTPVRDIASARAQAQRFADRLGLKTGEVMQFANNFYVLLTDTQGTPATEVLVDPQTGLVTLEYGPAMMWNTRYGMMRGAGANGYGGMMGGGSYGGMMGGSYGGMMGGSGGGMMGRYGGSPNWTPPSGSLSGPLTVSEAQRVADRWLATQGSGLTAAQPDALPGYFTFHTLKDGKITGMLSVNQQTGAVWYHWWHGRFIAMAE
jgi:hypothetical protein